MITNEILDFAKEMGIKDVSMDFDLVDTTDIPVAQSVDKIIEMRRYATEIGLNFYGTWETPYRVMMLNSWLKSPYAFCPAMEGTTIEYNGPHNSNQLLSYIPSDTTGAKYK